MLTITKQQATQFILAKQGLIGAYRFTGKKGAYDYVRQAGCIQFDPVDVCGKNAELTLQSRVKGFRKSMLQELLYEDRKLVELRTSVRKHSCDRTAAARLRGLCRKTLR